MPMPMFAPLTKSGESTMLLAPKNAGTYPATPPVVVTLVMASGVAATRVAAGLFAGFLDPARAKAEAGSPPRVAASAAFNA